MKAIRALLSQPTISAAADECGLHRMTLHRHLCQPDFRAELRRQQQALLGGTTSALVGLSERAVFGAKRPPTSRWS